ncbi:hypothetical protein [Bradyrhizobium sp. USDA 4502]
MTKKPTPKATKAAKKRPAKKAKKQTRPSTTRSTAGPGFDFEDRVAAWLLLKALTGEVLPSVEGTATRLQMQVEALHWTIDDILLTTQVPQDDRRYLAISCKGNVQVTASALPADFVGRCWEQWGKPDPNPMQRGNDRLLLVTRGQNNAFMATWSELKSAAGGADDALALGRMRASAKHRAVFDSVKKPATGAGVNVSDSDVVAMIRIIDVVPLDFHIALSKDEASAIRQARSLLVSGSQTDGKKLWETLIALARNTRLGGGTLDLSEMWRQLRVAFVLKDHPDYSGSWTRLRALTLDYRAIVETSLPSGISIDRGDEVSAAVAAMGTEAECVVFGESGVGKSALVKAMLDERFPDAEQVWFGPDTLEPALSEAARVGMGLAHPLVEILHASARAENVFVIDAAEHISETGARKAKALIAALISKNAPDAKATWRVVIIGQTEAWIGGTIQALATGATPKNHEVKALPDATVRQVLRSVKELQWLATHDDAVSALANLRTLAWVIEAAASFKDGSGGALSLTAIADRLWAHWTDRKPSVHRLLVQLAMREAAFEHSFAISTLESGDVAVLDTLPDACPLRRNDASGRIQFQHDLAADWARFQRLKEIAGDTAQWTPFAGNPFWHGALRMLGQLLLRQPVGSRTAWDAAFEEAEKNREAVPLADDVLLDALFLDPNAETFLNDRADMLFAHGGERLLRLVNRFEYIATVPGVSAEMLERYRDLSLYLETRMRMPIPGRWPAMARFLVKHRDRVAKMTSPAIAGLCERWLTNMPTAFANGVAIPYREEFASIALASAREAQLIHAKGIPVLGEGEIRIYQATFAGAPDLPAEISEWALEMAGRRPVSADIRQQVRAYHLEQAKAHKERLASDPQYRKRQERREHIPVSIGSYREKLPPWPLGAQRRIEGRFREAVLRSVGFQALMRSVPAVAGEVLFACLIEDEPGRDYGSRGDMDRQLGGEFDNEGYPTAPWKSPFYIFLQINPDVALGFLHQFVDFCTERWVQEVERHEEAKPRAITLHFSDGSERSYFGNYWVFAWSSEDSNFIGQLHSALAALERWLCDLIDAGHDITARVDAILRATSSVAVLGVLVSVGKHHSDLFKGPLRPLLGLQKMYEWDLHRAKVNASGFNAMAWVRSGEAVFEMARRWATAPYRQMRLRALVPEMIVSDRPLAEFVLAATGQWVSPESDKGALEFRILVAELDYRNYTVEPDPATGKPVVELSYPKDIAVAIASFGQGNARGNQALLFPDRCRKVLTSAYQLTEQEAAGVAGLMSALNGAEDVDLPDDMKRAPLVAAAVVLLLRAKSWLGEHAAVAQEAESIVDAALAEVADDKVRRGPHFLTAPSHIEFAGYYAFERWAAASSQENDRRLLCVLTGGDEVAVRAIAWAGYANREHLGARWWQLLYVALLWSGLKMLAPRYGDDDRAEIRWIKWRRWLRSRRLSAENGSASIINPLAVAKRVERLEVIRWQRRYASDGRRFTKEKGRRLTGSLETHFLGLVFAWLFRDGDAAISAEEWETHRQLVSSLWEHQVWWLLGSGETDRDDYQPMQQYGYAIIDELARLALESPVETAPGLWQPIFALGPKGHYSLGHFFTTYFSQLSETTDVNEFGKRWRPMVEALVLNDAWANQGLWFHAEQIERHALGFGATNSLSKPKHAAALVLHMRDCCEAWAKRRLTGDEDNLAGFCGFLATAAGRPLRLDGVSWIADAMKIKPEARKWYRERTSNAFMSFLDVLVSEHAAELVKDETARQALLDLAAHAVSCQFDAAHTLQERIRRLF